ncbi:acyl-CoA synthetase (NDP forming)/RimJ/RimL family protein N-acetyltransferase [Friedmanniella endophytica]|uniref:Acyl-CoA synthetase (NDP forming)/RimJ/RimL family protein N-acetyltransferase n=1 Tax=Microlunatus kandeliicorticis TaxID=1759536 RepID=A0A7W3IUD1_9ACTN|nr:GNAT family N-acetyltransferase [Microlunatus kandeliicorticis]MBA8795350.1 acyl-CoA synthetase (NDP forming)/RimJ/RimL family protein N-acetyltransferase [Microlunatus kandeliicorticis]
MSDPPGYPREWEADVLLSDGALARLRPIRPDDAELLVQFYDRVSPESKYLRFFAPYPRLSERDVRRFTQLDYVDRVAFIVVSGGRMIGVGRYERLEDDRAEVAFLVEDAHQGRGVAQLLLEHLAEAARERGITGFTADVLPENRRMAQVFADAGYKVTRGIEDGVLSVDFPILPTDTSVGVMERREHRAEGASMQRLLTPRQVVIVGPGRRAQGLANSLLEAGFRGRTTAISTDDVPVNGVTTARSLATVERGIDLVVSAVPVEELGALVIDAAHKGAHGIVVLSGSAVGPQDNRTVINLARAYGIRAVGPDALGLINTDPEVALNASPGPMPRNGAVGVFCQSAAIGVGLLATAVRQHLGLSSFISTGDVADVTANDVMQFWEDDEATTVCMLSLDRIGNPRKFSRIVRRLARRKPVLVFSPGQARRTGYSTERGGSNQAPSAAVDALFRQSGVMVVHRRELMFDIAQILARQPLPNGPRVRVITNSSSLSHQLTRSVDRSGLLAAGPVVVTEATDPLERVAQLARTAMQDDSCDSVLCALVGVFAEEPDETRWALSQLAAESTKPLVACFLDFTEPDRSEEGPDAMGTLPILGGPVDAVDALAAASAYAHWRERDAGAVPLLERIDPQAGQRLVNRVLSRDPEGRRLTDEEAAELLDAYGIALVPRQPVFSLDEAVAAAERFGWNVVLKATAPAFRGRPDLASVFRHLDDRAELGQAWSNLCVLVRETGEPGVGLDELLHRAQPVVQPMAPAGVALTVGSVEDDAFGPIVSLGLEGIASELLGDVVYRVPPLTDADARAMVRDLRAAETLFGRNGGPQADVEAIQELLHRLAELADDLPQLSRVTLSPCIAAPHGVAVLGADVRVAPSSTQRDPMARSLG